MDTLTFISKIIDSVIWPTSALVIIIILKKPIKELLPYLNHLKIKDLEFDFDKRINEIEKQVEKAEIPDVKKEYTDTKVVSNRKVKYEYFERLAKVSPDAAMMEIWIVVEKEIYEIAQNKGIETNSKMFLKILKELEHKNILSNEIISIINSLRILRNEAVQSHPFSDKLTTQQAIEYIDLMFKVKDSLALIR